MLYERSHGIPPNLAGMHPRNGNYKSLRGVVLVGQADIFRPARSHHPGSGIGPLAWCWLGPAIRRCHGRFLPLRRTASRARQPLPCERRRWRGKPGGLSFKFHRRKRMVCEKQGERRQASQPRDAETRGRSGPCPAANACLTCWKQVPWWSGILLTLPVSSPRTWRIPRSSTRG